MSNFNPLRRKMDMTTFIQKQIALNVKHCEFLVYETLNLIVVANESQILWTI